MMHGLRLRDLSLESYSYLRRVWEGTAAKLLQVAVFSSGVLGARSSRLGNRLKLAFSPGAARGAASRGRGTRLAVLEGLLRLGDKRDARDLLVAAQPHHDHALGGAAESLDLVDRHPDARPAVGDQHHLEA